jgi:large subunit ribosomal protein L9
MKELAHQLEEKEIILKARSGASDRLFGSITSADIVSELKNTTGLVLDKKKLELPEPIRHLGSYQIVIKLAKDISPTIKVTIEKEETV